MAGSNSSCIDDTDDDDATTRPPPATVHSGAARVRAMKRPRSVVPVVAIVLGFAVITIGLTVFWIEWGRLHYGQFLKLVAPPIYDLIGFGDARVGAFRQRYINFVPFVGLVLVTPGLAWKRRFTGLAAGLGALFVGHLALNLTERVHRGGHLPFVPSLVSDALPFLLWILVAYPVLSTWFVAALAPPPTPSPTRDEFEAASPNSSGYTEQGRPTSSSDDSPRGNP